MKFVDLGRLNYASALSKQLELASEYAGPTVLFCEHEPCVYTAGKRLPDFDSSPASARLRQLGAECHSTTRGGLVTWHGVGQLTVYPILDISAIGMRAFVHRLESVIMAVGRGFGIECERMAEVGVATVGGGFTRTDSDSSGSLNKERRVNKERRKFGFIGVAQSHGISYHGLAINVSNDLQWFSHITPCGIEGLVVTSLEREAGTVIPLGAVKEVIKRSFTEHFPANNP